MLNFVAVLQRGSETTKFYYSFDCQRSLKIYVRYFSMLLYLKAFQKIIKNLFISFQTILYLMTPLQKKCILTILNFMTIVGKGGHTPLFQINAPFSKIPSFPFLEIQDVPTFHRFIGKTEVLNNSCNQFVYNFYPQSIFVW